MAQEEHTVTNNPVRVQNVAVNLRPASVGPSPRAKPALSFDAEQSTAENHTSRGSRQRRGRGGARDGGRGGGRGGARVGYSDVNGGQVVVNTHNHSVDRDHQARRGNYGPRQLNQAISTNVPTRQFGGRLTTEGESHEASSPVSTLQADAPEFTPGQQIGAHAHRWNQNRRGRGSTNALPRVSNGRLPRLRRGSSLKSTAPDIATRTHEDISNGLYECPICTSEVARNSKVWSCRTCWTVFHLTCIMKWSQNEGSKLAQTATMEGDLPPPRQWRCPGCNLPKETLPTTYSCWCEKEDDPKPISGLPPHSCGQTCGKHRVLPKKCPHPCDLQCHAGPCPPCTHMGPSQSCFCGKQAASRKCVETNYESGWSCEERCGEVMPCGDHTCSRPCHEGLCGACEIPVDARCYCGKSQKRIICSDKNDEKESKQASYNEGGLQVMDCWVGIFNCGNICERPFDCGVHVCEKACHAQVAEPSHCTRSPDIVSHCPCSKSKLEDILDKPRKSCKDPIPNCHEKCLKGLQCGHPCQEICHPGPCLPCLKTVDITCRCGRTTTSTICHQGKEQRPQCMRVCRFALNCGRHACGERCCIGEKKAAERQSNRRKLRPLGASSRFVDDGFEAEHICTRLCGRILKCGNHQCPELCHKGPCGSCREAIFDEISCHCERTVLQPPLPCGTSPPPCRYDCGRPKSCGHSQVQHNCHGDDEPCPRCPFLIAKPCMCGKKTLKNQQCWLADVRCGEICGKKLRCGSHFCRKPCHRPGECEDSGRHCQQPCGKSKKYCGHPCEETCHAPSTCKEEKPCQNKMLVTCECQHLKQEMKCNASKTGEGNSKRTLKCDEECARLERNRRLASALNIDSDYKDNHIPYSSATLQAYQENIKWSQTQERELRVFAADDSEKRLRFKPMPPHQRAFLHSLAEDFGLDSESMDPDPYRHVALFKTPRFVKAPMKTLQECVRIQSSAAAAASEALEESRRLRDNNEPYNGFLLSGPKFGLTLEELRHNISTILDTASGLSFTISFLPSEEIVLKAAPKNPSTTLSAASIGASLKSLKTPLSSAITAQNLAISTQLVTLDSSLNIIRRDPDALGNSDGWSQVAAKAAGPRLAPKQMAVGSKSVYTVLGSRLMEQKKKKKEEEKKHREEDVVEDWMEEFKKDEEDEQEDQEDQEEGTKRLVVDNVEGGVSTDAAENVNGNKEIEKEREKAVVTEEKKTEEVRAV